LKVKINEWAHDTNGADDVHDDLVIAARDVTGLGMSDLDRIQ